MTKHPVVEAISLYLLLDDKIMKPVEKSAFYLGSLPFLLLLFLYLFSGDEMTKHPIEAAVPLYRCLGEEMTKHLAVEAISLFFLDDEIMKPASADRDLFLLFRFDQDGCPTVCCTQEWKYRYHLPRR